MSSRASETTVDIDTSDPVDIIAEVCRTLCDGLSEDDQSELAMLGRLQSALVQYMNEIRSR